MELLRIELKLELELMELKLVELELLGLVLEFKL